MGLFRRYLPITLAIFLIFSTQSGIAYAQDVTRIETIRQNSDQFLNEVVTIEGVVRQYVEGDEQTTSFYTLQGDYGNLIDVRTSAGAPTTNEKYRVRGVVGVDPDATRNRLYVSEESRRSIDDDGDMDDDGIVDANDNCPSVANPSQANTYGDRRGDACEEEPFQAWFWGLIVLLGLLGGGVIYAMTRTGPQSPTQQPVSQPDTSPGGSELPEPETTVDNPTTKISHPPQGTLKVLPGRFEVVEGLEDLPELRFYKQPGKIESEITFGRTNGKPYSHIQLKSPTVSSKQAKLVFSNGNYRLINYASSSSNPTRVNGSELDVNESVELNNGDHITMGEVQLRYSAN